MSEHYKNPLFDELMSRIEKDYTFALHRLSSAKNIAINHVDIKKMDEIIAIDKSLRPEALKTMFIDLNKRGEK